MKFTGYITPERRIASAADLGRVFGIRLRLHYTWIFAFAFITVAVVTQFPESYPLWQRILLGIVAGLLFLIAMGIREFVLIYLAIHRGITLQRVTLFVFGGVSQIMRQTTSPILELLFVMSGLLSTLVIVGIFYIAHLILVISGSIVVAGLTQWSYFIIFMMFLLHLVPSFPLDGGRFLRAIIWRTTGDYERATRITIWTGQGINLLFIASGILLMVLAQQWFIGPVLIFLGWVLQIGASQGQRQAALIKALKKTTAQDIMMKGYTSITPQLKLGQLIKDYILATGQRYFLVVDGAKLKGIVTMRHVRSVPRKRWNSTLISEIMIPASELKTAHPRQAASALLEQMDELGISHMPIIENGTIIGIVAQEDLTRLARTRVQLKI